MGPKKTVIAQSLLRTYDADRDNRIKPNDQPNDLGVNLVKKYDKNRNKTVSLREIERALEKAPQGDLAEVWAAESRYQYLKGIEESKAAYGGHLDKDVLRTPEAAKADKLVKSSHRKWREGLFLGALSLVACIFMGWVGAPLAAASIYRLVLSRRDAKEAHRVAHSAPSNIEEAQAEVRIAWDRFNLNSVVAPASTHAALPTPSARSRKQS